MLELNEITKIFGSASAKQGRVLALQNVNARIERGEFVAVIGPSGCGKSTILEIVAGLQQPTSGSVTVEGERVAEPHPEVSVVFQDDSTLPWLTARENVEFGLKHRSVPKRERTPRAMEMLELVDLGGFSDHYPAQLSGGMRQRVALARALATNPKLLLMDEPFGALDEQTRLIMGDELLRIWEKTNSTILFITHSLSEAAMLADRILLMSARPGHIREDVTNPVSSGRSSDCLKSAPTVRLIGELWELLKQDAVKDGVSVATGGAH